MCYLEQPIIFHCENCRLLGIATITTNPSSFGVLILVGGPQYRSGSHRQFTLLARDLAEKGIPSFRFDYRGMGDSEGDMRSFQLISKDIKAAIDAFTIHSNEIKKVIIWGLCDAASAALHFSHTDKRVAGLILLNPWVHTEIGASRARLKHYYFSRFKQKSFWSKLLSGEVNINISILDFINSIINTIISHLLQILPFNFQINSNVSYIDNMHTGMQNFTGDILYILSGNDIVSQEFQQLIQSDDKWIKLFNASKSSTCFMSDANHTFSSRAWRNQVSNTTINWLENKFTNKT